MLNKSTLDFLKGLSKNNNRDWFQKNKAQYDKAQADFAVMLDELIKKLSSSDKSIADQKAKDCIFRIYRDVRFAKDKSPYKTNFGASINQGGKKAMVAGYYIHLQPGNKSFLAGGVWMPPTDKLAAIRQEIDYQTKEFKKILGAAEFKKYFGSLSEEEGMKLKTAPKGYPKDHPEIELLKFKSYLVWHSVKDAEVLSTKFVDHAVKVFRAMQPLNRFVNRAMN